MIKIAFTNQFEKDIERCKARNWDFERYKEAAAYLSTGMSLPKEFKDHPLNGDWKRHREFHFGPDRLVIYYLHHPPKKKGTEPPDSELTYVRMGSHSDLFR